MGLRINRWLNRHPVLCVSLLAIPVLAASGGFLASVWVWTQVVLALCLVIFVHELGHFMVAKWCGVQCDKFYIGFDIYGLKLFSKKWGETEYGIGLLPLGGYVKMLGQEDNPAKITEEIERAKATGEEYKVDPRSYLAKSVPQRMAIISAGVIMNVIFAWVVSSIAYGLGVKYTPGDIGGISAGGAAWQVGIEPGDKALTIADVDNPDFKDLRIAATFDNEGGVPLIVKRDGETKEFQIDPSKGSDGRGILGVEPNYRLKLLDENFVQPGTPAAEATPAFRAGDRFVAIGAESDSVTLETYQDWNRFLVAHQDKNLVFTVERDGDNGKAQQLDITVRPRRMRSVGVVMTMGKIVGVRASSVAEGVGLQAGDILRSITPVTDTAEANSPETVLDPMRVPQQTRQWAHQGRPVNITVERDGNEVSFENVVLTPPEWTERSLDEKSTVSVPALGVAYRVTNRIKRVNSDAAAEKIEAGAEVVAVTIVQPDLGENEKEHGLADTEAEFDLTEDYSWPYLMGHMMQYARPGSSVKLHVVSPGAEKGTEPAIVELPAEEVDDWTIANRGFYLEPVIETQYAQSFVDALSLGLAETGESLTLIYRFLGKIPELWRGMGGPITIVRIAGSSAERGLPELLIFIAMLSANLAVINFLPIPVLDGGHFVFLTLEGIRGKPVSERVFLMFTYLGFLFLLAIMVFTIGLDITRLAS
ncbi:MAG: site-2 protease family protein [Pirellulales bacterium]|nr:site-2 protease family protein [Pirellulales bacterium]